MLFFKKVYFVCTVKGPQFAATRKWEPRSTFKGGNNEEKACLKNVNEAEKKGNYR